MIRPCRIETWNGMFIGLSRHWQSRARPRRINSGARSSSAGISANTPTTAAPLAFEGEVILFKQVVFARQTLAPLWDRRSGPVLWAEPAPIATRPLTTQAGCATPSRPSPVDRNRDGRKSPCTRSPIPRRTFQLTQIPEQAGHDTKRLFGDRQKNMFIGRVLGAAGIGVGDPHRRQTKDVGKDVIGQRAAEIRQDRRRLPRRLADRIRRPVDPGTVEISS